MTNMPVGTGSFGSLALQMGPEERYVFSVTSDHDSVFEKIQVSKYAYVAQVPHTAKSADPSQRVVVIIL